MRFTMTPGESFTLIGVLPSRSGKFPDDFRRSLPYSSVFVSSSSDAVESAIELCRISVAFCTNPVRRHAKYFA